MKQPASKSAVPSMGPTFLSITPRKSSVNGSGAENGKLRHADSGLAASPRYRRIPFRYRSVPLTTRIAPRTISRSSGEILLESIRIEPKRHSSPLKCNDVRRCSRICCSEHDGTLRNIDGPATTAVSNCLALCFPFHSGRFEHGAILGCKRCWPSKYLHPDAEGASDPNLAKPG